MDHALARWAVLIAGLLVAGSAGWSAIGSLSSPRGIPGPGIVDAVAPASAAMALLLAFATATVVAVIVGRLLNPVVGLFTLGVGLGVIAMRSGTIRDASFDGGSLMPLAIESLLWAFLIGGASIVVHRMAKEEFVAIEGGGTARATGTTLHTRSTNSWTHLFDRSSLIAAAIGAVAIVGVWLLITSAFKGQAIGAAVVGGFIAGHVAKRTAPDASPALLFATPILFVAIVQCLLAFTVADPASSFVHGAIPNLLAVMPLDLVSGSVVGVAMGIGMAHPPH